MAALTESNDSNTADSGIMNIEFVQFSGLNSGDFFDCKKLREIEDSFASQSTTDGIEIQCSNSGRRVTITLSSGSNIKGYLVVIGRM